MFELHEDLRSHHVPSVSRSAFGARDFFEFAGNPDARLETRIAKLGQVDLHKVRSTGHRVGLSILDRTTALLPQQGVISVESHGLDFTAHPGDILLLDPGTRVTTVSAGRSGGFAGRVVVVPTMALSGDAAPPLVCAGGRGTPAVRKLRSRAGDPALGALISYISYLFDEGQRAASPFHEDRVRRSAGALLKELMIPLVSQRNQDQPKETAGSRSAEILVRAAEQVMEARSADAITIAEIAALLDVSSRTLQLAFRMCQDRTPLQALAGFRMERVHGRLLSPNPQETVTQIALDCGFTHLSRFASAYHQKFGERPSETLARSRLLAGF